MHVFSNRQLLVVSLAFAGFSGNVLNAGTENPLQELHAARIIESTSAIQESSGEALKKMRRIYDDLAVKYPRNARVRNARAEFFWRIDERARAEQEWSEAERIDPKDSVVLDHLANCALSDGALVRSVGYYRRAVEGAPEEALYHFNLANVLFMFRKDLAEIEHSTQEALAEIAMNQYSEATRLAPENEAFLLGYGESFFLLPDPDWRTALEIWERFLQLSQRKDFALSNLARIHLQLGEKEIARDCVARMKGADFLKLKELLSRKIDEQE